METRREYIQAEVQEWGRRSRFRVQAAVGISKVCCEMQEIWRLWEGDNWRVHRCPEVRLRPTRPLHGARLRMELQGGLDQPWNGILGRRQTGPGQGEAGLKMVGGAQDSFHSYKLEAHLVGLALCGARET